MRTALYLVFPHLHLVEFNTHAGAYVMGVPQPTAIGGFAHALARHAMQHLGATPQQLPAFAYAVSRFSGFSGISLNQRQMAGTPKGDAFTSAPISDRPRANLDFSLIVELIVDNAEVSLTPELLTGMVQAQRLQAGSIFCKSAPSIVENFSAALALLPATGFVLCDAAKDMQVLLDEGQDTTTAMASLFARPIGNAYKPRHVPVITGWEALQTPDARPGVRSGAQVHAYAEPVLSAGLFRSVASARKLFSFNEEDDTLLWVHIAEKNLHTVRGVAPYLADIVDY